MRVRRIFTALVFGILMMSVTGCGTERDKESGTTLQGTEKAVDESENQNLAADISLWTYPVGDWGDEETVNGFISEFNKQYPNIKVQVKLLDYVEGDAMVAEAIEAGNAPDIVMEGPERIVSNWGARDLLVNVNDLWNDSMVTDVSDNNLAVLAACMGVDGNYYEYPLSMNAHCMAVNKELFEASGAIKYINQETHTWTTQGFEKALIALKEYGIETTGVVYCGGQGGDQGTRALAMNLYNAQFTNGAHTTWEMGSEAGQAGISQLVSWCNEGLLSYDSGIVGADELEKFAAGGIAMTFCWNASNMAAYAEQISFTPYAVAFPSEDGIPELAGGIYGFGIFDNKDDKRAEAAKRFIEYVCSDAVQGPDSVRASGFFPVRSSFGNVYEGEENEGTMEEFSRFMPFLGDYYNVIPGWTEQRTAWWTMLQKAFAGEDLKKIINEYIEICDTATNKVLRN